MHTQTLYAAAALVPIALASPLRRSADVVSLIWTHEKATSKHSLTLLDADKTKILGQSCDEKLDTGDFAASPISFDVNENGFGTVTVDGTTFKVHSKQEYSGGITCSKSYSDDLAKIECLIPWTGAVDLSEVSANMTQDCFNDKQFALDVDMGSLSKRQGGGSGGCLPGPATGLVGEGDPHQNYFHKQVSQNIECRDSPSCSVGHEQIHSQSYGWSVDFNIVEWISGGFAVTQEYSQGNQYSCYGDPGDTVCVWYKMAHTAYTVVDGQYYPCSAGFTPGSGPHAIVKSPNQDNVGGNFYCVVGPCRSLNSGYWGPAAPPGGP